MSKTKTQPKLDLDRPELYINRELSWLDFNARVLEEALDQRNPLLERVKFMAIVASNLDEFYEVRVAGVLQLHESGANPSRPDGLTPAEQLERIAPLAHQQVAEQYRCWNEDLIPALAEEGIFFWEARQLEGEHLDFVHKYWEEELELILTPIVVDPAHPFPRVINKALCIGALLESQGQSMMGVATVPRVLPRILRLPDQGDGLHFVTLAGIMELQTSNLFRGYQVLGSAPFRVTRNSELYVNEKDADNLLEEIEEQVINLRQADAVYLDEIRKAGLYDAIWQAFAVLLPVRTVGVMGDARTYDHVCALRAVTSTDGMTADYYPFDHEFLGRVATRIINEVKGINRVVYDVTSKPPGTIEWE